MKFLMALIVLNTASVLSEKLKLSQVDYDPLFYV